MKKFLSRIILPLIVIVGIAAVSRQLIGPSTSTTDNALVVWDGTGAYKVKNSSVIFNTNGSITIPSNLVVNGLFNANDIEVDYLSVANPMDVAIGGTGLPTIPVGQSIIGNDTNPVDLLIFGSGFSISGSPGSTRTISTTAGSSLNVTSIVVSGQCRDGFQ